MWGLEWWKEKQSLYRPGQTLRALGGGESQNVYRFCTWMWQSCQPYALAAFTTQEISLVLISVRCWVFPRATVRPEGWSQWNIPKIPRGIEPANFWLVAPPSAPRLRTAELYLFPAECLHGADRNNFSLYLHWRQKQNCDSHSLWLIVCFTPGTPNSSSVSTYEHICLLSMCAQPASDPTT